MHLIKIKHFRMKKIIIIITLGLLLISCDPGEGQPNYSLEILPVSGVVMPTAFRKDSITEIKVKYLRPTSCHFFESFYYTIDEFDRTVAIYSAKANQEGCQNDNVTVIEVPLNFRPTNLGTYHFKFWTGENATGGPQYIEYEAIVNH